MSAADTLSGASFELAPDAARSSSDRRSDASVRAGVLSRGGRKRRGSEPRAWKIPIAARFATIGRPDRSGLARLLAVVLAAHAPVGCGPDSEKLNPVAAHDSAAPGAQVETILELDHPPGNVTVSVDGRVFFTFHPAAEPEIHVAEVTGPAQYEPFPDERWQSDRWDGPSFVTPLSLRADSHGRLWILDHGDFGRERATLTAFDISTREVVHRFEFPPEMAGRGSMLNDFWVDSASGVVYVADTSPLAFDPALVVYDIGKGTARRLLEDHHSVRAERHHTIVQGRFLEMFGVPLRIAVDSIALSADRKTLYFGPLTGSTLYAIDTGALTDETLSDRDVRSRVHRHGPKPATDGIAADSRGNLFLTAIEHDAIWKMSPDGSLSVLARDPELLSWPDGVHLSATERTLYVSASELQHVLSGDLKQLADQRPFRILRIALDREPVSSQ
jgi:sugar lactone lactonase YvrE